MQFIRNFSMLRAQVISCGEVAKVSQVFKPAEKK